MKSQNTPRDRFWSKVTKTDSCWLWRGSRWKNGYGEAYVAGKRKRAHRVAWELTNGTIPIDMLVCHKCDVKLCVNPDHLYVGTVADNNRDMIERRQHGMFTKPDAYRGKSRVSKLTWRAVRAIREKLNAGKDCADLAKEHSVHISTIQCIRRCRTWKPAYDPEISEAWRKP